MRFKIALATALAAAAALVTGLTIAPAASAAHGTPNLAAIPVTGTIQSIGGTFNGTASIQNFAVQNGQLVANGTLTGTLLDSVGNTIGTVTNTPVAAHKAPRVRNPSWGGQSMTTMSYSPSTSVSV